MTTRAYALTIAGCPWAFTSAPGLPSLASTSPLWPDPPSVAEGFLVTPTNRWTERARPLEGDLETDPQRFQLHDATATADGATRNLLSYLATREAPRVASTPITANISASATTFDVGDASVLTLPGYVWINGEAIDCSGASGNTVSVTARGALGTKAVEHLIDPSQALYPEAFATFPWITRRKVCLWAVDTTGDCELLWVGYATRAPSLADDGTRFDLACDPAWTVLRQNPVGGALGSTRAVGFGTSLRTGAAGALLTSQFWLTTGGLTHRSSARSIGPFRDWSTLARDHEAQFAARTSDVGARIDMHVARAGTVGRVDADVLTATVPAFSVTTTLVGVTGDAQMSTTRGTRQSVSYELRDVPGVGYMTLDGVTTQILVTSLSTLPTSWSITTTTDGAFATTTTPALRCQHSERLALLLTDITTADSGPRGARVEGLALVVPRKPGLELSPSDLLVTLRDPPPFQVIYRVRTDHWAWGLRRSVVGLCEDAHPDDFDWSEIDDVAEASAGLRVARDWYFDGRRTLGETVTEACLLHGCTPVLRSGRLALHAWAWPDAHTTPAVSLTRLDLIGLPTWTRWQEGVANRLQLKSDSLNLDASQARSRTRYGPGRAITVTLAGLDDQASPIGDPMDFARGVLGRLELWDEPLAVVRFRVSERWRAQLELGRELLASEWMLPDGAGARGLAAVRAVVLGREVDLSTATLTIEALIFAHRSYPYAPCARVGSQITTSIVELATAYVGGTTTYSGGNDSETFHVGDKCDLVSRESSPVVDAGVTITAINTTTRRVTFASPMSSAIRARIAAGAIVDLRYATWSTPVVAGQEPWMYVGDNTTRTIDGTSEPAREIAP
jgi:hypothetical protein